MATPARAPSPVLPHSCPSRRRCAVTVRIVTALLLLSPPALALAQKERPRGALDAYLAKVPGAQAGRVVPLTDVDLQVIPGHKLYAVRFRGYPVKPPKSFKNSNLFAVSTAGMVKRLSDGKALKEFFRENLPAVTSDKEAKAALRAWLRLAEELHQDGYYQFKILEDAAKARSRGGKRIVSGKARVTRGGEGQISATLTFDADGKLAEASTEAKLKPTGARPAGARP